MKKIPQAEVGGPSPTASPERFTGPVQQLAVHAQPEPQPIRTLVVTFSDGARSHWHAHGGGQVLHVIDGEGLVQSRRGDPVQLRPGDIVVAEPGEEHWHGAAPGASMRHLAVSLGETRWLEAPD
jgi:quercetin dioxygenase-like cupin family protein